MSVPVPSRAVTRPQYGWSADGKSAAEISDDIEQTRYRLESDVRALRAKLAPRRLKPIAAAVTGGLLALSLAFRTIDAAVCPRLPVGTHFLWHLLNAAMLSWMIRVLVRHPGQLARV